MLRNLEIIPATESWSELLDWVNRSMPVEAPNHYKTSIIRKVEECGHGVPYVLMLPSMLPIIHSPLLTSKVKVPAKADYEAAANLKIMQDALRRNGIVIPDVLAHNQQKLIGRNFQANLKLLQWFRGLYVALQQAGIEAGEGRITLAAPSNEESILNLGSPPAAVVLAKERRRTESMRRDRSESQVLREVREADSKGDAAAAAAVAILSERRSESRNSLFENSFLNSSQPRHNSVERSLKGELELREQSQIKSTESPASALPLTAFPPAEAPAPPANASQIKKQVVAAPASAPPCLTHGTDANVTPSAVTGTATKSATSPNVGMRRRASATQRPSTSTGATRANGNRPRTATGGRNSAVFKPIPARLSFSGSTHRQPSERSVGTPRTTGGSPSSTQNGAGSRTPSTPKGTPAGAGGGATDAVRVFAPQTNHINGAVRPAVNRQAKSATKPIIMLDKTVATALTQNKNQSVGSASAPAVTPALVPALSVENKKAVALTATTAPGENAQAANVDVLQLQADRQFYYDKLRTIEELVDAMEAKKKQERKARANMWNSKDDEMMDFTNAVRSVLYAEC